MCKSHLEAGSVILFDVFITGAREHSDDGGSGVELGHSVLLDNGPVATGVWPCGETFEHHTSRAV